MITKSFEHLKADYLFEIDYVSKIGSKISVYPFVDKTRKAQCCYLTICFFILVTVVQLFISLIDTKFEDWFEIINIAPNLGVCVLIMMKYTKMHTCGGIYNEILTHFKQGIWEVIDTKSSKHRNILDRYTNISRIIVRCEYYYTLILIGIVILFPRIIMFYETDIQNKEVEYLYPFDGWYPFDKVKWYYVAYVWESCMTTLVIFIFVFANMIHISFTRYICMELKILGISMEDLINSTDVKNITKKRRARDTHEKIAMKLKRIIKQHQFLVRIVSDMDDVMGAAMLLIYIFGSVFICLTIFTASVVKNLYMSVRYFSFFCSLLVEVYIQCIIGQLLIDHSSKLEQAIYFADWPYADRNTKQMLLIFLIRAQRPLTFTAKGYLVMNLDTFCGVCSLSYQFFNLLRTVYA